MPNNQAKEEGNGGQNHTNFGSISMWMVTWLQLVGPFFPLLNSFKSSPFPPIHSKKKKLEKLTRIFSQLFLTFQTP